MRKIKNKDLVLEMYNFAISLALDLEPGKFEKHRDKWNFLMGGCEKKKK